MILKNLSKLECQPNTVERYKNIANKKQQPYRDMLLKNEDQGGLFNIVKNRYSFYEKNLYSLEKIRPLEHLTKTNIDCLKKCYTNSTNELTKLLSDINEYRNDLSNELCFYCGFGEPDSWDHYCPKGIFPEFSIHPYNLVPCCKTCNNKKGEEWLDSETEKRKIINFYFDQLNFDEVLIAEIQKKELSFSVKIKVNPLIDEKSHQVVSHIKVLNLLERLNKKTNTYFNNKLRSYKFAEEKNTVEFWKSELQRETVYFLNNFGNNYWKYTINKAILSSPYFFL